jgi:prepilin-type N-terminal cleavage/methylation domain-containing protein
MNHGSSRLKSEFGFTIVELLVVIVIIGILAAITLVSYTGITQKAIVTTIQSDLSNASDQLKIYQATYGSYPTTMVGNCPTAPTADNAYCIKASTGNTLTYSNNGTTFALTDTNTNGVAYGMNDTSSPVALAQPTSCPTGFIPVPGSATYGQAGFCVMKYAASHSDATSSTQGTSTVPISAPSVQQWVNISQTTAIANSPNVAGCTGCHLITEAEWMTIAQNVLSVASNWDDGAGNHTVGVGYIYSGNNDGYPGNASIADPSDANGYTGTSNTAPSNQRRTLTLTNGQVIWDLAGNIWEWTAGTVAGGQPGVAGNNYASYIEWSTVTTNGTLAVNPFPSGTGLSGASTWNSGKGVGKLISSTTDNSLSGFLRGGFWGYGGIDGVLALYFGYGPSGTNTIIGFRVSR